MVTFYFIADLNTLVTDVPRSIQTQPGSTPPLQPTGGSLVTGSTVAASSKRNKIT